ncbi:Nucleoside-diphosphate-sugar epimerase [Aliiroseovarius sediminilitoris]|uniref:Nucleoside-diphosphate-sugar epimerase n=1 Tax=Aliiroseovarius sediminilitoris TaxID=1173584 RepID=A0A1I0R967_9RHOB|nr:NAD(P)-dependent oxidoreductase [Aliiroseovarius sediminilitoris]SEW37304.1 Nucleoside-diphosphate-sugar epimerase [Aliiroseovarius sediminilitoris]
MDSKLNNAQTVLVTGATGFIGAACLPKLTDAGFAVIGTYRGDTPPAPRDGVTWIRADLSDAADIDAVMTQHRPSHLLALAWYMGPGNQQSRENFRWLSRSIDLLAAFADAGGTRVTFCGSCMEYDWSQPVTLNERTTPLRPDTPYGAAKAALFSAFGSMCDTLDLSGSWARPFFLYGPGENPRRLAADVVVSLLEGREALCTHGQQARDFLHVDDVADAMVRLLQSDLTGPVNIGSGAAIPLATLINEIGRQTGAADLIRLGAREARPGDPPLVEADITRLHDELGWTPTFDLETGVADTIDWWRHELKKEQAI